MCTCGQWVLTTSCCTWQILCCCAAALADVISACLVVKWAQIKLTSSISFHICSKGLHCRSKGRKVQNPREVQVSPGLQMLEWISHTQSGALSTITYSLLVCLCSLSRLLTSFTLMKHWPNNIVLCGSGRERQQAPTSPAPREMSLLLAIKSLSPSRNPISFQLQQGRQSVMLALPCFVFSGEMGVQKPLRLRKAKGPHFSCPG